MTESDTENNDKVPEIDHLDTIRLILYNNTLIFANCSNEAINVNFWGINYGRSGSNIDIGQSIEQRNELLLTGVVLLLKINAYASLSDGLKISLILSPLLP